MDFDIPADIQATLDALDAFIEARDHAARGSRTTTSASSTTGASGPAPTSRPAAPPGRSGRTCSARCAAGPTPPAGSGCALPAEFGGHDASNLEMAIIREHLARKGLGLHNDLQNESSIVGNFPTVLMMRDFGTDEQRAEWMPGFLDGTRRLAFGLTEPNHGSDATYLETTAVADGDEWVLNGQKRFNSGPAPRHPRHHLRPHLRRPRLAGRHLRVPRADRRARLQRRLLLVDVQHADRPRRGHDDRRARAGRRRCSARVDHGLELAQHFVHENRIRQAASSLGAGQHCIDLAVGYANERTTWGKRLATNQGIQFPLVELHTEAAMLRQLIRSTAWQLDRKHHLEVTHLVAMCNYRANRFACEAADRAMQTCGGLGYSRHMPFEHIYRHHRRYRITEGAEEIQMRKVAQELFGFGRSSRT